MAAAVRIELDADAPDAIDGRQLRAAAFEQVRAQYVQRTLVRVGLAAPGATALVVGGGRGILPRTLARLGFDVVAVDPSATTTRIAQETAQREDLAITHRTAPAERPAAEPGGSDLVYCADTFEITGDLDRVLAQADLAKALDRHGLHNQDVCGFKPRNPRGLIQAVLLRRRGRITDDEATAMAGFVLDPKHAPVTYLGYATED